MTRLDDERQRVPARVCPQGSGEFLRPGLVARTIEGVCPAAHLEVDGIEVGGCEFVDDPDEGLLLLPDVVLSGPVEPVDRRNPYGPDFTAGRSRRETLAEAGSCEQREGCHCGAEKLQLHRDVGSRDGSGVRIAESI